MDVIKTADAIIAATEKQLRTDEAVLGIPNHDEQLMNAAEQRAALYDDGDRDCIKADVMNAFYAGAAFQRDTATPQPFPAPAVQSGDLDIAVNVFKSLFFNDGLEGESLDEQLRRAMRAAFISSGQAIAQTAQQEPGHISPQYFTRDIDGNYHAVAAPSQGAKQNG